MLLRQFLPNGRRRLFTLISFAARLATLVLWKLLKFGLTGDLPFITQKIAASGRSFITANVAALGGLGVAIALLLIWAIGTWQIIP
jgi:hypothetical protein